MYLYIILHRSKRTDLQQKCTEINNSAISIFEKIESAEIVNCNLNKVLLTLLHHFIYFLRRSVSRLRRTGSRSSWLGS